MTFPMSLSEPIITGHFMLYPFAFLNVMYIYTQSLFLRSWLKKPVRKCFLSNGCVSKHWMKCDDLPEVKRKQ